jgi:antitoxin ChpS
MHTTHLRKVGGSVMLPVPPALLKQLALTSDSIVELSIDDGFLMIRPNVAPSYTLNELLAASDYDQPLSEETREWIDSKPIGRELL